MLDLDVCTVLKCKRIIFCHWQSHGYTNGIPIRNLAHFSIVILTANLYVHTAQNKIPMYIQREFKFELTNGFVRLFRNEPIIIGICWLYKWKFVNNTYWRSMKVLLHYVLIIHFRNKYCNERGWVNTINRVLRILPSTGSMFNDIFNIFFFKYCAGYYPIGGQFCSHSKTVAKRKIQTKYPYCFPVFAISM